MPVFEHVTDSPRVHGWRFAGVVIGSRRSGTRDKRAAWGRREDPTPPLTASASA